MKKPKHGITSFTGNMINLADPLQGSINILDIAHHLSNIARWNGATRYHYSVAQHSLLVEAIAPTELKPWALMHDAAEAYYGDDTRPKKQLIPELKTREKHLMQLIANEFGLTLPEPPELKKYDDVALAIEECNLMPNGPVHSNPRYWALARQHPRATPKRRPEQVEAAFLRRFRDLFGPLPRTRS